MPNTLNDNSWETLLQRVQKKQCTPFLGAGVCYGVLPIGQELAKDLAKKYHYPLPDDGDLARVTQFIAIEKDGVRPKEEIQERLYGAKLPDFSVPDEPHALLADLPLPIYLTTNYDNYLVQALKNRNKSPKQEFCRWNDRFKNTPSVFDKDYMPEVANPLVFHLHGQIDELDSMVVTEDDYLDYLMAISQKPELIPPDIQAAFANTSLLFLGYRLADWNFRVLFRSLVTYLNISNKRIHISVQLLPMGDTATDAEKEKAREYFDKYFQKQDIHVYWGTCREFTREFRTRWEEFKNGR